MESANTPALLLLDLPASALAGIDLLSFTVTPRFRGVKDLPAGFHFAFVGTSTAFSERHGLWFYVPNKSEWKGTTPLFVTKWDPKRETLVAETEEAELLRWRANLGSLWREGLTPYRQTTSKSTVATSEADGVDDEEEMNDWPRLTSHITPSLLSRITAGDPSHWHLTSTSSATRDLEEIPGLSSQDLQTDRELHLLPIDLKQTWRPGATGRERTEAAQDRSWALEHIAPNGDYNQLLGELQFCFLMILTLNNFSCLEQWKRLLALVFTCKSAIPTHPHFFIHAIAILRFHLQHCQDAEGGLIDLTDEGGNLVKSLLVRFRRGLENLPPSESPAVSDVADELDDLEEYLQTSHGWQFGGDFARSGVLELEDGEQVQMESTAFDEDDETGEFAPQVVELTAEQAKLLGVTPEDARELGVSLSGMGLGNKPAEVVQDEGSEDENVEEEDMQDLDDMDPRM